MKYQNRFVIFIDFLGWKEKIKESETDEAKIAEIIGVIEEYHQAYNGLEEILKTQQVSQFSDCIAVSFEVTTLRQVFYLLEWTRIFLIRIANRGFLCRGGMALGKLIHTPKYLFGTALNDAYALENKSAIFPRVIIGKELINSLQKLNEDSKEEYETFLEMFEMDFDGFFYIDYFKDIQTYFDIDKEYKQFYGTLQETIKKGLSAASSEDVRQKYNWLKIKLEQFKL